MEVFRRIFQEVLPKGTFQEVHWEDQESPEFSGGYFERKSSGGSIDLHGLQEDLEEVLPKGSLQKDH